ncbi:MAG: type II toxin-antitoxin system Phd/YefM family antitoxin [Gemmatimonadaceae bacterium]
MSSVNIHQAKTHLSRLLQRVASGEEIIISNAGKPVARLVPIDGSRKRRLGTDEGAFEIPDDFNDPLPPDILDAFQR